MPGGRAATNQALKNASTKFDSTNIKAPVDTVGLKKRIVDTGNTLNTLMGARSQGGVNSYDKNSSLNMAIDMTMDNLKSKTDSLRNARKRK
jgi:hypothetical protein